MEDARFCRAHSIIYVLGRALSPPHLGYNNKIINRPLPPSNPNLWITLVKYFTIVKYLTNMNNQLKYMWGK